MSIEEILTSLQTQVLKDPCRRRITKDSKSNCLNLSSTNFSKISLSASGTKELDTFPLRQLVIFVLTFLRPSLSYFRDTNNTWGKMKMVKPFSKSKNS